MSDAEQYISPQASALHTPVLRDEVLHFFHPVPGMRIMDCTLGLGGHAEALLLKAQQAGVTDTSLLGLDRDPTALALAQERLSAFQPAVRVCHARFSECSKVLDEAGWDRVDFVLADIGVSSMQMDRPERGFSFRAEGPLDMRMDQGQGPSACSLVNHAPVQKLKELIAEYGEDPMAGRIARAIDDARAQKPFETTEELARIVERAYPAKWRAKSRNHPATRTFQAIRMAVNQELSELEALLQGIVPRLAPGGKLAVITFHSLEDRMVKHFFREQALGCRCPRQVPVCVCGHVPALSLLTKKPLMADEQEKSANPRAKSAKLRVAQRI